MERNGGGGVDDKKNNKKNSQTPPPASPRPIPSQHRQLSQQAAGKSSKKGGVGGIGKIKTRNRVVDESPQKSSFPKKGTTKSKLKHLNKKVFSKLYESSHV